MKKKVAIIGTVGLPAKYGGFETLTEYLVDNLNGEYDFTVYCSSLKYDQKLKTYNGVKLVYIPLDANGKSSILYDMFSIIHSLFFADVLLVLGVSGAFMFPFVKFFTKKKIITNIDGLEWKRDKWGGFAKKYLKKQEKIAVKYSHVTVVDNEGIKDHVSQTYQKKSSLISYGGNHVTYEHLKPETRKVFQLPKKYAFKVCRIEPENNIHIILEAFSKTNINLVLVGNWDVNDYGKNLKKKYKHENLFLLNPIYNQEKLNELRSNCAVYIHGHSAGGTNPSLVEAMNLELAILAFDVHYNRFTTKNEAIYFKSAKDLEDKISKLFEDDFLLNKIASKMKNIAIKEYTWEVISKKYKQLFQ